MEWFCSRAPPISSTFWFRAGPSLQGHARLDWYPSFIYIVLGHTSQRQHVKADVTYAHGFVQVKFDDGDLFYRALVAEQAPTMAAMRKRHNDTKLYIERHYISIIFHLIKLNFIFKSVGTYQ